MAKVMKNASHPTQERGWLRRWHQGVAERVAPGGWLSGWQPRGVAERVASGGWLRGWQKIFPKEYTQKFFASRA